MTNVQRVDQMIMKQIKWIAALSLSVFSLLLVACGSNGQRTYFPGCAEMKENLEGAGYTVNVTDEFHETYTGTYLSAEKDNNYIEFYWLNEVEAIDEITEELKAKHEEYDRFESRGNDSNFGTHVYCGTNAAIKASGIRTLKIKVDEIKVDIDVDVN